MISTLIVDDEQSAREELAELLKKHQDISIVGQCANAVDAMGAIVKLKPDLIFLDIEMPRISGMEMLAMIDPDYAVDIVFVTAYDNFALEAFEKNVADYVLKPIEEQRLALCLDRIGRHSKSNKFSKLAPPKLKHLPCFSGKVLKVVAPSDVDYVYSDLSGIHIVTADEVVHSHLSLKIMEEKTNLVRCHRQYLINPSSIAEIDIFDAGNGEITTHRQKKVPISRRHLKPLKEFLGFVS